MCFKLIFLLLLTIFHQNLCQKPTHECKRIGFSCTFSQVILNKTHYEWTPVTDDVNAVTRIDFYESRIPVFSKDLCETFPNLEELYVFLLSIEEIKEDAFESCKELQGLHIFKNNIKTFHPDTFKYATKLETIQLYRNLIESLNDHTNLFSTLTNLEYLDLGENNLTEFSPELVKNNKKLVTLHLYSNELADVDVEQILEYLPNLKFHHLHDNEISCVRIVEIGQLLKARDVEYVGLNYRKVRYYPQETVFTDVKCNPDVSWMASSFRKEVKSQKMAENHKLIMKIEEFEKNMAIFKDNQEEFHLKLRNIEEKLQKIIDFILK